MNKTLSIALLVILTAALIVSVSLNVMEMGKVKDKNTVITNLQEEIDKVEAPRHFNTTDELKTWLASTGAKTTYAALRPIERAYILQVLALRDGYLLPAYFYQNGGTYYSLNTAYIQGTIYVVSALTYEVSNFGADGSALVVTPISSQPLPLS